MQATSASAAAASPADIPVPNDPRGAAQSTRMLEAIRVVLDLDLEDFQGDRPAFHQEDLEEEAVEDHQVGRRSHRRRHDKDKMMQH